MRALQVQPPQQGSAVVAIKPQRGASYGRFSTEAQNESSIERQFEGNVDYAARNGIEVVASYADRAKSGFTMKGRDGLAQMLCDAESGAFDFVIVENIDRLSRKPLHAYTILERLTEAGVEIRDWRGPLTPLMFAVAAGMAQAQAEITKGRMSDGRRRSVRAGRSPHTTRFGYRRVYGQEKGIIEVHSTRAAAVREIFARFDGGASRSRIARDLTGRFETPGDAAIIDKGGSLPRLSTWTYGMITEILRCRLYAGKLVDGMTRRILDRDGQLVRIILRPSSEWTTAEVPKCRIVEHAIWLRANKRLDRERLEYLARKGPPTEAGNEIAVEEPGPAEPRAPSVAAYLLASATFCGCCGARVRIVYGRTRRLSSFICGNV